MKIWHFLFYFISMQSLLAQSDRFTIVGRISNPDTSQTVKVTIFDGQTQVLNVPLKDGAFKLSGSVAHPALATVGTSQSYAGLGMWITNDPIRVEFERRPYSNKGIIQPTAVSGSQESKDYLMAINSMNGYSKLGLSEFMANQKKAEFVREYVSAHPKSYLSLFLIQMNTEELGVGNSKNLFNVLSTQLRGSIEGVSLKAALERNESNAIGKKITKVNIPNAAGKATVIPSQTKQYSLINFWASWCAPCRHENKDLVELYKTIDHNKVEVVSISVDDDRAAWLAAIKKDGLTWPQLSDLKGWKGPIARQFSI
ncbi:TlpA disulfide reductase family protein [Dyadobacter sp. CY326]|uniref:TlpA disulfide reductase family protein n=1 Tax=Dyadobacter sp. CY326 TaxID=2907300 RepID=UPI001F2B9B58|nr:TlpA disulfide reductase family protein [Dyadobacter sp. CY326]MCE7067170.1 AhpC/TSA family protein [Dyadobacter sp. CY326]